MHAVALLAVLTSAYAAPQSDEAMISKIVEEGKNRNQAHNMLRYLSKNIGTRLTGSTNLDKAYDWTAKKFKEFGCKNVHLEEWGQWDVGFDRGKCSGAMVSPEKRTFEFTTQSWTEGTHGKKKGIAVAAPTTMEEFERVKGSLKGAWVVYQTAPARPRPGTDLTPEQKAQQAAEEAITSAGILGRVTGSRNELVITSGSFRDKTFEKHPMDVSIQVRKSDMDKVMENLQAGKKVELEFDINQKFIKGPRKHYNVIAEIPGSEKPDEVIIVGGHIDTWDGPGSEGAADNGNGTAVTLEAARILCKVGAKPKRTIRFILFSGEEQGLFGSRAYVEKHRLEMGNISAVFIEDGGANYEGGTYALESMLPHFEKVIEVNNRAFPDLPMKMRTVATMPRGGGSDHVPFNAVGVPGFFWDEVGGLDYGFVHHTQNDTFERVPENFIRQSATNSAVTAFLFANHDHMLPRAPATQPATGGSLFR